MHQLEGSLIWTLSKRFDDKPSKKLAKKIIKDYYEFFDGEGMDEILWFMVVHFMRSNHEEIEGRHRSNVLYFYECTKILNKAVFYLNELINTENEQI